MLTACMQIPPYANLFLWSKKYFSELRITFGLYEFLEKEENIYYSYAVHNKVLIPYDFKAI